MINPKDLNVNQFFKGLRLTDEGGHQDPTYLGWKFLFDFNPHQDHDDGGTTSCLFAAAEDAHKNGTTKIFLEGLLTPSEQIMLGRRIWIARMLLENKTYQEIGELLHVGPHTVMRTELWLQGMLPDYDKALVQMEREEHMQLQKDYKVLYNESEIHSPGAHRSHQPVLAAHQVLVVSAARAGYAGGLPARRLDGRLAG